MDLNNKIAVITGAASGIGKALATRCVKEHMRVVLADIEEPALMTVAEEFSSQGADILAIVTDVTEESSMQHLADRVCNGWGTPTLFFNNAGVGGAIGPVWEVPLEKFMWSWQVNLMGVLHGVRAFVPKMIEQEGAWIVNTGSMAGFYSAPYLSSYEVAKHGVVALTQALYHDLKARHAKLNVALLSPGWVKTSILNAERNYQFHQESDVSSEGFSDEDYEWIRQFARSVKKGIAPEEVAEIVFKGLQAKQFYIFTDEAMADSIIKHNFEGLSARDKPRMLEM